MAGFGCQLLSNFIMPHSLSPKRPDYQAVMGLHGTFDWKELGLTAMIPPDAFN